MHYHGADITPRSVLLSLAGRNFCVSYAYPSPAEVCHEIGQSVMLDNGAFSFWRLGKTTDWDGYYAWCERWLEHRTTWAVIPDVIDGNEDGNDALVEAWPFGTRGAPVWHMHESLDRLERLCYRWPLVCFGSSGDYATLATPRWHRRMAEAMAVACDDKGRPRCALHMLRGLAFAGGPYPFASADSSNIARNHAGDNNGRRRVDPRRVADEFDGRQCPTRWTPVPEQMEMAS